jgi:hypothetical protein
LVNYQEAREAASKGAAFLEGRVNSDGSVRGEKDVVSNKVGCYYKTIWALASSGRFYLANSVADFTRKSFLHRNGDFADKLQRQGDEWFEWRYHTYLNIWLTIGAHTIGRFDLSFPGSDYILTFLDPKTGGFCNERPYPAGKKIEDSLASSGDALACLYVGRLEEARKTGDFLIRLLRAQPEPKKRFYTALNGKGNLIRDFPSADEIYRVVDATRKEQYYFMVGLPMALLSKLYLATNLKNYLDAARGYFQFTKHCADDAYSYPASGKSGFGSAILARITGNEDIKSAAERQLEYLVQTQDQDGAWKSFPGLKLYGNGSVFPIEGQIDITGEFTVWLNEMLQELDRAPRSSKR